MMVIEIRPQNSKWKWTENNYNNGLKLKQRKTTSLKPKASWQEVAGVLVFSAIPFTAVKAIANSPLGESLQRRLLQQKSAALDDSIQRNKLALEARQRSPWYGPDRPRWLGPIPFQYPSYLTGDLPADYGFDLAALAKDPPTLLKYYNFEILHARWAMLGALGALFPELLNLTGVSHFPQAVWWKVGYSKLQDTRPEGRLGGIMLL